MINFTPAQHAQEALVCVKSGDIVGAIEHFRQAIEQDANQPAWVYGGLGNQLLRMNQIDDAEPVFQLACDKYPEHSIGFAGLAVVAQRRQHWDRALERWNACLAKFPQQVQAAWHANKANVLMEVRRFEEAAQAFHTITESNPEQPQGWVGLAKVAERREQWAAALGYWKECLQRFPGQAKQWWSRKGNVLLRLKDVDAAREIYEELEKTHPEAFDGLKGLALSARIVGDYELCLYYCQLLIERFPTINIGYQIAEETYIERGQFDQAAEMFTASPAGTQVRMGNDNLPGHCPSPVQATLVNDVIFLIVTCEKNLWKSSAIRNTWLKKLKKYGGRYFFVMGDPTLEKAEVNEDVLFVPCRDDYESLLLKLALAYQFVNKNLGFSYIYKIDDDVFLNVDGFISIVLPQLENSQYAGGKITSRQKAINVLCHYGKCSDERFHKPYPSSKLLCDYAGGGRTYFLAKSVIHLISEKIDLFQEELDKYIYSYEDIRIAEILYSESIDALQINHFSQKNASTSIINDLDFVIVFDINEAETYSKLYELTQAKSKTLVESSDRPVA
jgi:tetratricopeptide (TPR) repeat protein